MNKADARYKKSRAAIIDAGIEVLLANPNAGMSEIAQAAGVGRATLYRHFETRNELVQALTILCLEETDEILQPVKDAGLTGLSAISASIDLIVPMADKYRFLMSLSAIAAEDATVKRIYRRQLKELYDLVEVAKDAGEIDSNLPTAWVVGSYDALLNTAWELVEQNQLTSVDAAVYFKRSFAASVAPG